MNFLKKIQQNIQPSYFGERLKVTTTDEAKRVISL